MPNYQNGKIYKIVCNITDECYIGSTCEPTVARRLATHVNIYKRWKAGKCRKTTSFDIIDRGDYQIFLIETYPCNSRDELTSREGEIIRKYKHDCGCTNIRIEGRTGKEYYQDNKDTIQEYIKKYTKEYSIKNNDKIKEYKKEYYEENKEKISEKHKKYRDVNQDKLQKYKKEYNEKNKEKISEQNKIKITCVCGSCYRKADKNTHERTKKHQSFLKTIE